METVNPTTVQLTYDAKLAKAVEATHIVIDLKSSSLGYRSYPRTLWAPAPYADIPALEIRPFELPTGTDSLLVEIIDGAPVVKAQVTKLGVEKVVSHADTLDARIFEDDSLQTAEWVLDVPYLESALPFVDVKHFDIMYRTVWVYPETNSFGATNGYELGGHNVWQAKSTDEHVMVDARLAQYLVSAKVPVFRIQKLSDDNGDRYLLHTARFVTEVPTGTVQDWSSVTPTGAGMKVVYSGSSATLKEAVKRAAAQEKALKPARKSASDVKSWVFLSPNGVEYRFNGETQSHDAFGWNGPELIFSVDVLTRMLKNVGDNLILSSTDANNRPVGFESGSFQGVAMPLRIK